MLVYSYTHTHPLNIDTYILDRVRHKLCIYILSVFYAKYHIWPSSCDALAQSAAVTVADACVYVYAKCGCGGLVPARACEDFIGALLACGDL